MPHQEVLRNGRALASFADFNFNPDEAIFVLLIWSIIRFIQPQCRNAFLSQIPVQTLVYRVPQKGLL